MERGLRRNQISLCRSISKDLGLTLVRLRDGLSVLRVVGGFIDGVGAQYSSSFFAARVDCPQMLPTLHLPDGSYFAILFDGVVA